MPSLDLRKARFLYLDETSERVLLDCTDLLANKSRISMHRMEGQTHPVIPEIVLELIQEQKEENAGYAFPFGILDLLLTDRLIRSARPVRLVEYGSGLGNLSVHLARLLGVFHEKSSLVCVCDTIEPEWMERISHVETPPELSYLAADYGNSGLQKGSFDFVVLNGLADFPQPYDVLKDAVSLAKTDGVLICYSHDTPLLESVFKLFFETRDEYECEPSCSIMVAEAAQCSWREADAPDLAAMAREDLARAAEMPADGSCGHEEYVNILKRLQRDIRLAVEQGETELKIQLLAEKERMLNGLVPESKEIN